MSTICHARLATWRRALLAWFVKAADKVVLSMYLNNALAKEQAPVSLTFQKPGKRKYVMVSAESKWSTLKHARTVRTQPSVVLALGALQRSTDLGCSKDAADSWIRKEQRMYLKRVAAALALDGASPPARPQCPQYIYCLPARPP